jgi:tetratricopeptide (TPR) repeat protein
VQHKISREDRAAFAFNFRRTYVAVEGIERREAEVRWIIRYGVIPRRLNKQFVINVMLPHLQREMQADHTDRPDRRYWTSATPNPEKGWDELRKYASTYEWVKTVSDGLQFGPEVRNPLRRVLRALVYYKSLVQESVFTLLHKDAADWFAKRAKEDPGNWVEWKSEELYHRLQLDVDEGMKSWRQVLMSGDAPGLDARWRIAQLLFDRDFLETGEGDVLPNRVYLAEAHYELATVAAQQAAVEAPGPRREEKWKAARREYDAGQKAEIKMGLDVLTPARLDLLGGAVLLSEGRNQEAIVLQNNALRRRTAHAAGRGAVRDRRGWRCRSAAGTRTVQEDLAPVGPPGTDFGEADLRVSEGLRPGAAARGLRRFPPGSRARLDAV